MEIINIPDIFLRQHRTEEMVTSINYYENKFGVEKCKVTLSSFLFSFVLSGKKEVNHLSNYASITPDEFLLLKPGSCLMSEKTASTEGYQSLLLFFNSQSFNYIELNNLKETSTIKNFGDFLVFPKDDYVASFISSIQQLRETGMNLFNRISTIKLQELLSYIIYKHGRIVVDFLQDSILSSSGDRFKVMIEKNVDRKLTIEELAFLCNMSQSTFNRRFKNTYGTSPSKWFLKQRLLQSKRKISLMRQKPSEVYVDAGFENLSSFTNAFKKEFGQLPSQMQKMNG